MVCQTCLKNPATVHVTELVHENGGDEAATVEGASTSAKLEMPPKTERAAPKIVEQHLCEVCAQTMDLPHMPTAKKTATDIWKLLQISAQQTRRKNSQACPECGMSLEEFRKKGRLGCHKDYEVFAAHIGELLERVHGARTHVGRIPGTSEAELERIKRLTDLRVALDEAIRGEQYESAAQLRDELKALEEPRVEGRAP